MSQFNRAPLVQPASAREIAPGVIVLPDQHIDLVPNIGIVIGTQAVLVVDCGMGRENGRRVRDFAVEVAAGKPLLLTTTHFHPEHAFGAQAFKGHATMMTNTTQAEELQEKGTFYLNRFREMGPAVKDLLEGVEFVLPDETYQGESVIDLGGKRVVLREVPGHTRGDQIVFLPQERVLFTGDLVENRLFPIFPDQDAHGRQWVQALEQMIRLSPTAVIPGHGEIGTTELLHEFHNHLIFVREEATRLVKERYQEWENDWGIAFEIRNVYAEMTGTPLILPAL